VSSPGVSPEASGGVSEEAPRRLRLAGIDEAGLGPVLGPLTIGYSVFEVPRAETDVWKLLARTAARKRVKNPRRLVVADSKKVFDRTPKGLARLERTVLSFLAQLEGDGAPPQDARALFGELVSDRLGAPWYERLAPLPLACEREALELSAARLGRDCERAGVELLDAGVRVVPAAELNDSFADTDNKSLTVWSKTVDVLRLLWRDHARWRPRVDVDIQGGRSHYGPLLARALPEASVLVLREEPQHASYRLDARDGSGGMEISFQARGEERSFAVALGSCLAKYARELVMGAFNDYFGELQPDLRPTAGYYSDAQRWLAEAGPALARAALERELVVRGR